MKNLVALTLLLVASPAIAQGDGQEYVTVTKSPDGEIFSMKRYMRGLGTGQYWYKRVNARGYTLGLMQIDCERRWLAPLRVVDYSFEGIVLSDQSARLPQLQPVVPESVGEAIVNYVCVAPVAPPQVSSTPASRYEAPYLITAPDGTTHMTNLGRRLPNGSAVVSVATGDYGTPNFRIFNVTANCGRGTLTGPDGATARPERRSVGDLLYRFYCPQG